MKKMENEIEIRKKIEEYYEGRKHIFEQTPKEVSINAYVALEQCSSCSFLDALYWVLGETRPHMRCDDFKDKNQ